MKIELKLTADQVFATSKLLENAFLFKPVNKEQKVAQSIVQDLNVIFSKKNRSLLDKNTLFDCKKKYNITLRFHEAYSLFIVLQSLLHTVNDIYSKTILGKIKDFLHQKLA